MMKRKMLCDTSSKAVINGDNITDRILDLQCNSQAYFELSEAIAFNGILLEYKKGVLPCVTKDAHCLKKIKSLLIVKEVLCHHEVIDQERDPPS